MARVYRPTSRNLHLLARRLQDGDLVAVPTETVYGLAGNALDPKACRKIFRAKGRPTADPLIVHIHASAQLQDICIPNDSALKLAAAFWPGPLTIVLPKTESVPGIVTAGRDSVAVRMPRHPVFRRLLKLTGRPLAAPSANPFGYISPTSAAHVVDNLGSKIAHVLDGGRSAVGLESTIVDLRDEKRPRLLRPGAISATEIGEVLGRKVALPSKRAHHGAQIAPGSLKRHYSPRTPVRLHDVIRKFDEPKDAYVFLRKPSVAHGANIFWLDPHGDLRGAARRLFAVLRQVDRKGFRQIHAERAPGPDGFAAAINDRLTRAAAR